MEKPGIDKDSWLERAGPTEWLEPRSAAGRCSGQAPARGLRAEQKALRLGHPRTVAAIKGKEICSEAITASTLRPACLRWIGS